MSASTSAGTGTGLHRHEHNIRPPANHEPCNQAIREEVVPFFSLEVAAARVAADVREPDASGLDVALSEAIGEALVAGVVVSQAGSRIVVIAANVVYDTVDVGEDLTSVEHVVIGVAEVVRVDLRYIIIICCSIFQGRRVSKMREEETKIGEGGPKATIAKSRLTGSLALADAETEALACRPFGAAATDCRKRRVAEPTAVKENSILRSVSECLL